MKAIRVGKLVDGTGADPLEDAAVLVDGGRIKVVGSAEDVAVPPEAELLDFGEHTIIPGMIDCHVHIHAPGGWPTDRFWREEASQSRGYLTLRAYRNGLRDLRAGFTTVRNAHSPSYIDVALRDAVQDGLVVGPRIVASGQGLTATGGHMDEGWWTQEVTMWGRTGVCDGPWECRRAAREQLKHGADFIKINAAAGTDDPEEPRRQELTYEEMAAICEEAHWAGKRVGAHAHGGLGVTDAIRAGLDSVEHGVWLTREQLELMAEHEVFYVPTLCTHSRGLALGPEKTGSTERSWAWLERACKERWASLERAKEVGVKIAVGTDAGFWMYHGENAAELDELVRGGFTPMEAVVAATLRGAQCLGLDDDIGTIEPGKYADLVVVNGDPLVDVRALQDEDRIVQVLKAGNPVK